MVRFLEEAGVGVEMRNTRVPIVPAAILFDLNVGGNPKIRPDGRLRLSGRRGSVRGAVAEGSVGAGAGATVGKMRRHGTGDEGGHRNRSSTLPDGTVVAALVAVNAVGDVIDPANGRVIAGVRTRTAARSPTRGARALRCARRAPQNGEQTTIGVVATNARLTKAQATKVAQMAHDGLARAMSPVHTPGDGDTIFALATGVHEGESKSHADRRARRGSDGRRNRARGPRSHRVARPARCPRFERS